MNKWLQWWKKDKRYQYWGRALLMAALPVLCCLISCAAQGRSIGEVYLPASEWNDELFYYKQVEGMVQFGYPQGYFGFNESHALQLSFAAWSPVLVFPWIIWGVLFGWNMLSPVLCNIVLLTVAVFVFVLLAKPNRRQLGVLTLLFCLFTPFVRYMLSGMPEVICFSMLILFYGVAVSYLREEKTAKLVWLFVLSGLLTLMRPYMLLFMLLPAFLWIRKSRGKGIIGSAVVFGGVCTCYALIKHYLGAEYFAPLFFTDWITAFCEEGLVGGLHNFFSTLYWKGRDFLNHTRQGFASGLASGAFFAGYLAMLAVYVWQCVSDWRRYCKNRSDKEVRNMLILEAHMVLCFVGMLFALLLMYKLTEGSKHLLTFMAAGIFPISLMRTACYKKSVFLGAVFAFFYMHMAVEPYDYQIPFVEEQRQQQIEDWREILDGELALTGEEVPNYENVCIWVFSDDTPEGKITAKWQVLYSLPEGFGISCCYSDYVRENFDSLQSRYIATVSTGVIAEMCQAAGYREVGRDADIVVYDRGM